MDITEEESLAANDVVTDHPSLATTNGSGMPAKEESMDPAVMAENQNA
jgi:hypothetical protein